MKSRIGLGILLQCSFQCKPLIKSDGNLRFRAVIICLHLSNSIPVIKTSLPLKIIEELLQLRPNILVLLGELRQMLVKVTDDGVESRHDLLGRQECQRLQQPHGVSHPGALAQLAQALGGGVPVQGLVEVELTRRDLG